MNESKGTGRESLATRVRRGVALLDREVPGWHNRIDVERLDIHSLNDCVLVQLFGCWQLGQRVVPQKQPRPFQAFGFDATPGQQYQDECRRLTRLWRFVVRSRQAAAFFAHPDVQGNGFDLVYRLDSDGTVSCWSERYGWHRSAFGNLYRDSEYDRAHFADHLVPVSVEQLPVGAR